MHCQAELTVSPRAIPSARLKVAVAAANNAFEGVQKAVKQASETAEANFQVISSNATKAAKLKRGLRRSGPRRGAAQG